MAVNKTIIVCCVVAGIVVASSAAGGVIFAEKMSLNDFLSSIQLKENTKVTGWQEKNGYWYYFDESGNMKFNWIKYKNKWYYLGNDGEMRTGWIQYKGDWYYLNNDGTMATNITIEGCYLNEHGILSATPNKTQ